jgi:hypothetical protein
MEVLTAEPGLSLDEALARLAGRPRGVAAIVRRLPAALPKVGDVLAGQPPSALAAAQALAQERRRARQRAWAWGLTL